MTDITSSLRATIRSERIWQFVAVGFVGTGCDFAVLISLVELFETPLLFAKVAGAESAIVVMFVINERWTFASWGSDAPRMLLRRLLTSNLVRLGGIVVATSVLLALTTLYGVPYVLANGVGIGAGFIVNYLMENLFTWQTHQS